jgi:hypothetical protein
MTVQLDPLVLDILPVARGKGDETCSPKAREQRPSPTVPAGDREAVIVEAPAGVWAY